MLLVEKKCYSSQVGFFVISAIYAAYAVLQDQNVQKTKEAQDFKSAIYKARHTVQSRK